MAEKSGTDRMAVARLGAPRGLGGFLKVHSYSGEFDHIKRLREVILAPPGNPGEGRPAVIDAFEAGASGFSLRVAGYDSPEKARALTGLEILVPRELASPLGPDEWYIADLVGLALTCGGEKLAEVTGVLEGGADPLLETRIEGTGAKVLVPFRKEFIGRVDPAGGSMELLARWLLE